MLSPKAYLLINFAAAMAGILCALLAIKVLSRGWVAIMLLLSMTLAFILISAGDASSPSHLSMALTFCLGSPFSVVYAFRARKHAPDKLAALAAFVGAFVVGGIFLIMAGTLTFFVLEIITHPAG